MRPRQPRRLGCVAEWGPIPTNISDHIGNTPMVRLSRLEPEGVELYGKLEAYNPGGSVKDRIGIAMIEAAEAEGRIEPGRTTIVEATSGNTGIALAFVCAAKGYELAIFLPQGMSPRARGVVEALRRAGRDRRVDGRDGRGRRAPPASAAATGDALLPDQFSNPANPEAHRLGTGPEILKALDDKVDIFVAGVGTGGTITGVGEAIKSVNPNAQVIAVEPRRLRRAQRQAARARTASRASAPASSRPSSTARSSTRSSRSPTTTRSPPPTCAAAREGVLAGISCGAALWGAIEVGRRPENAGKRIVTILPDSGERYISAPFFAPGDLRATAPRLAADARGRVSHRRRRALARSSAARSSAPLSTRGPPAYAAPVPLAAQRRPRPAPRPPSPATGRSRPRR